ncbi:CDP-glycerol glycerophosphotransferase family protein [Paeniglutamicibacter sp. NPDC091659]|uniref:CDP-glycerol glycerophosphotransferase family protein n=1 Tax=Paeniglutamicibacter sp. NPDC091659 TaxID=3364389 RepID=UPI0038147C40
MTVRNKNVWLFNSANTFTGNPKWLFTYIHKHRADIEAWWICDSMETIELIRGLGFKATQFGTPEGNAIQKRAGVFVVNQVKEHIAKNLEGATILNLWHGVGVKNIERGMTEGYLSERIAKKYIKHNRTYRESQLFLVTSPMMEEHFRKQIGLAEHNIIRAGYPQNTYTKQYGEVSTFDHDVLKQRGLSSDAKIAIYSPTPRRESSAAFLAQALPDMPRLIESLESANTLLIVKMHPHMENDASFRLMRETHGSSKHLLFWDNKNDIYEIFGQIDLAIIDYSSILYDMLAAGVSNVIRYIFDYNDGTNPVLQPEFDYLDYSCGTIAMNFEELLTTIGSDNRVPAEENAKLEERFWEYSSPSDCESIVDAALKFEPVHVPLPTLYSFDIFDTVIHRRGVLPVSVFYAMQERIRSSNLNFPRYLVDRFPEARQQAEAAVRENRRKRREFQSSGMLEIQFEDIYQKLASTFMLSDEQCQALMAWETEIEVSDTLPNAAMIDKVRELKNEGNDVILISDMYLPEATIKRMLAKADPLLAELPLFLSSTVGLQKSTRRLYLHVYRELSYDYEKWVHTGDNDHADIKSARAMGIQTVKRRTPTFDAYERALVRQIPNYDGYQLASMLHGNRWGMQRTSHEQFSFRHVALYLVPYVDWVVSDALRRGYKTLYFVSRDGHHMKRICDALIEERGLTLRTAYIYGSRASWRLASQVNEIDDDVFSIYGSFSGTENLKSLAEIVNLSASDLVQLVPEIDQHANVEKLSKTQLSEILAILKLSEPFRKHVLAVGAIDRDLVSRYLDSVIDFDEEFALVEYWGRGYTQDCLINIVEEMRGERIAVPFYYARSIYSTDDRSVRHNFTSANYSMLFMEAVFANLEHGTVAGFSDSPDGVVPVMLTRKNDPVLHRALEKGLVEFARLYARTDFVDLESLGRNAFRFGFEHFKAHPGNNIYVQRLGALKDSVEMGATEREFAPAFTLKDITDSMRGSELLHKTRSMQISLARTAKLPRLVYHWENKHKISQTFSTCRESFKRKISRLHRIINNLKND